MNKIISIIFIATLSFVLVGCEKKTESSTSTNSTETAAVQTSEAPATTSTGSEADKLYTEGNNYHNKGDIDKAFEAFSKSSELGNACASFFIGIIHENGEGGRTRDMKEALAWYKKSSDAGCNEATKRLAMLTKKH